MEDQRSAGGCCTPRCHNEQEKNHSKHGDDLHKGKDVFDMAVNADAEDVAQYHDSQEYRNVRRKRDIVRCRPELQDGHGCGDLCWDDHHPLPLYQPPVSLGQCA